MKRGEETTPINADLNLIYSYYCRLNPQKMKHKHFDDFTQKTEAMDLHQFMTFCKDVSLNAKRNKKHGPMHEGQGLVDEVSVQQLGKSKLVDKKGQDDGEQQQLMNGNSTILNESRKRLKGEVIKNEETHMDKKSKKGIPKPKCHLDERRLAEVFKKYSSPQCEINFEQFESALKDIAEQMYRQNEAQRQPKSQKSKIKPKNITRNPPSLPLSTKQQPMNAIQLLLQYLKLDTKQHMFEFYSRVNQLHGNLDHLVLLRSPVKKIQVKNDPLGKYAGKENNDHSRLIETVHSKIKDTKKEKTLPVLQKTKNSYSYIAAYVHSKSSKNILKKQGIQAFLKNHQTQINQINQTYQNSKVSYKPSEKGDLNGQEMMKTKGKVIENEKKPKTYSQRHRDKIMNDNNELGKLIDVSELYSDEIFNKYLEINHSPKSKHNSQTKLVNARLFQHK